MKQNSDNNNTQSDNLSYVPISQNPVSIQQVTTEFVMQTWPFTANRFIEVTSDFITLALLSSIDKDHLAAGSLIAAYQAILRGVNATAFYYISPYVKSQPQIISGSVLQHAYLFALGLGSISCAVAWLSQLFLEFKGQPPDPVDLAFQYLKIFGPGIPLILMGIASQQVTIGLKYPKLVLYFTAISRLIGLFLSYGFLFGSFGLPKLGTAGLGWSSTITAGIHLMLYLISFAAMPRFRDSNFLQNRMRGTWDILKTIIKKGMYVWCYAFIE